MGEDRRARRGGGGSNGRIANFQFLQINFDWPASRTPSEVGLAIAGNCAGG